MNELPPGLYKFIKIVGLIIFSSLSIYISIEDSIKKFKAREPDNCIRVKKQEGKQEKKDCCKRIEINTLSDILFGSISLLILFYIVLYHFRNIYNDYLNYKESIISTIFLGIYSLAIVGYNISSGFLIHYSPDNPMKIIKLILIDIVLISLILFSRSFLNGADNKRTYIIYLLFAILIIYLHFNDNDNCFENIEVTKKTCKDYDCNKVLDEKWTEETASMWTKCCPLDTECYTDKVDKYIDQDKESYDNKIKSAGGGMITEEAKYRVRKEKCKVDEMRKDIEDGIYA